VRHSPDDYWYEQAPLGKRFWSVEFVLVQAGDAASAL
jgi:hypothetical protein